MKTLSVMPAYEPTAPAEAAELESVDCVLCHNSDHVEPILTARDQLFGIGGQFTLCRCGRCGLCFTNPRPPVEAIGRYYTEYYQDADHRQFLEDYQIGPRHGRINLARSRAHRRAGTIARLLGSSASNKTRLLDVGCGMGGFLYHCRQLTGWDVQGLDFDGQAVDFARDELELDGVKRSAFIGAGYPDASFDVVCMWHYLEHTHHPDRELAEARRVLRPGGVLAVGVPNFASWTRRLFARRWAQLQLPTHLYHFTPATLSDLAGRTGLDVRTIDQLVYAEEIPLALFMTFSGKGFDAYVRLCRNRAAFAAMSAVFLAATPICLAGRWLHRAGAFDLYASAA